MTNKKTCQKNIQLNNRTNKKQTTNQKKKRKKTFKAPQG